jgi:hypothetical protein
VTKGAKQEDQRPFTVAMAPIDKFLMRDQMDDGLIIPVASQWFAAIRQWIGPEAVAPVSMGSG